MDPLEKLLTYLKSETHADGEKPPSARQPFPFITISRKAGASGTALAKAVLAEMEQHSDIPLFRDWHIYDKTLCETVARDMRYSVPLKTLVEEVYKTPLSAEVARAFAGTASQGAVTRRMFQTILAVAHMGKALIIGRGGNCLTWHLPLGLHIRLVASRGTRLERVKQTYGLDRDGAERKLKELDASRARLVRDNFGKDIDDPLIYDAIWNVDSVPLNRIASVLVKMVQDVYAERHEEGLRIRRFPMSRVLEVQHHE